MIVSEHQSETRAFKQSVAVFYPSFAGGGAESVGLWILEALKEKYNVTLVTLLDVDFPSLNSMYGTHLSSESVKVKSIFPKWMFSGLEFIMANNSVVRKFLVHLLIRYFKSQSRDDDLALSAYNAIDLGRSGIQYIHWINVFDKDSPFYKNNVSEFSDERMKSNLSLANSYMVADAIRTEYGLESTVVYPPVVLEVQQVPWEQKENAFICSGRLTEPKQPHKAINILKQVREKGFDVKLYLTGGGGGFYGLRYLRFLKKMVAENSDWVTLYQDLPYRDYVNLLSKCRYGFHYKREPFGISIAEMVKAGAIPFVRTEGGQTEIVGQQNQDLLFMKDKDAAEKIVNVLSNLEKQQALRLSLEERQQMFSTDKFMSEINRMVDDYFMRDSAQASEQSTLSI